MDCVSAMVSTTSATHYFVNNVNLHTVIFHQQVMIACKNDTLFVVLRMHYRTKEKRFTMHKSSSRSPLLRRLEADKAKFVLFRKCITFPI